MIECNFAVSYIQPDFQNGYHGNRHIMFSWGIPAVYVTVK